jgi:hypothetical protein
VAVIVAVIAIDGLAAKAIQAGGTYALGVRTTLQSASVGILSGRFAMSGLTVDNPAGSFKSPHFLSLGEGEMAVSLSTLRQPTVTLPRLGLSNLDVNLEKKDGQTNYAAILDNLKRTTGDGQSAPKPASTAGEKRYIIQDLDLQKITVHVDLIGGPGAVSELTRITIPIDRIKLSDVGRTGTGVAGTGVTLSELAGIIVKAVLAAASDKGGGLIPDELLGDLKGKLAQFQDLDKLKMEVMASARGKVEEVGKKMVDDLKKKAEEALKERMGDTADKLKDLIPGDKKDRK